VKAFLSQNGPSCDVVTS